MMKQNEIQLTGTIDTVFETEPIGNFFEKRRFWLRESEDKKSPVWELELQQGDCVLLDKFKQGQQVMCNVEVKGVLRVVKLRNIVFNTLVCKMICKAL